MKTALVLSGGGARGAYEAGVVAFLREELEPQLGRPVSIDILCGTSVGAITACALAATAECPEQQGKLLRALWMKSSLQTVLQFGVSDLARSLWELGGGGLANPDGMRRVLRGIGWRAIGTNIAEGRVKALSIAATRVADGKTVLFVRQAPPAAPLWLENTHFEVVKTRIGPRHALASAAIPVLFAPVEIRQQLYLDGGLRMNVPLSPALRLGAQRVAVISLQPTQSFAVTAPDEPFRPTAAFLAGKAMNSLLQDRLERDVENLRRFNAIIESGVQSFGPRFMATLNDALSSHRNAPLRFVRSIVQRPSRDLGVIASRYIQSSSFRKKHAHMHAALLRLLAGQESEDSADLASYLLFDPGYAEELIALGRADAKAKQEDWAKFFDDAPASDAERVAS